MQAAETAPAESSSPFLGSREFTLGLLEHSPVPYAVFDQRGRCVLTNPAYRTMFGAVPPPEYTLRDDPVARETGLAPVVEAAFCGEVGRTPVIWYDPTKLPIAVPPTTRKAAIAITAFPLRMEGADNGVTHIACAFRDVTAEVEAKERAAQLEQERRLRESTGVELDRAEGLAREFAILASQREEDRTLLDRIIEQSSDAVIMADETGAIRVFNAAAERQYGISRKDLPADWLQTLRGRSMDGAPLDPSALPLSRALKGETVTELRWQLERADGRVRVLEASASPLRKPDGTRSGAMLTSRDITEQQAMEDALRAGEELFRRVFESEMMGMLMSTLDGQVLDANDAFLRMIGYTRADVLAGAVRWDRLSPPEWTEANARAVRQLEETGSARAFEKEYFRRDGSRVPVLVASTHVKEQQRNVTFVLDISDRKRLEQGEAAARREAQAQQQRLHALFMQAPMAICVARGPEHVFTLLNPHYQRILGGREVLGLTVRQAIPELEGQGFFEILDQVYATGEPYVGTEQRAMLADERGVLQERYFNFTYQPTRDSAGNVDGVMAIALDVTEQVRGRQRLEALTESVRRSEQRYRSLVEATAQIVWTTSPEGLITEDQPAWRRFTGQTFEEIVGTGWAAAVHPDDRERTLEVWTEAVQRAVPYDIEHRLRRADGRFRVMRSRAVPVLEPSGRIREWVGVHTDVTSERRAEEHVRFLSEATRLLSETLDAETVLRNAVSLSARTFATYCFVDRVESDGKVRRVATAHRDPARQEVLDRSVPFVPAPGADTHLGQVLRTGESLLLEHSADALRSRSALSEAHRRIIEELAPTSTIFVPLTSRGRIFGAITFSRDVALDPFDRDDLAVAEEFTRRTMSALENALLFREATEAVRTRDDFLSVASHELKTPLTPLSLKLESIVREAQSHPESPFRQRILRDVGAGKRQVRKLAELVNDLLDVSRISAGRLQLELEEVDLTALVREVTSRFEPEAARAGSSLGLDAEAGVIGLFDRGRVDQIVTNLVSNAIKYGSGKPIRVSLTASGGVAHLEVADQGIGISPEALPRMFNRFERAVSNRNYGGLGLGLYISRTLAEAMRGTIRVESELGKGSRFFVDLPLRTREAEEPGGTSGVTGP